MRVRHAVLLLAIFGPLPTQAGADPPPTIHTETRVVQIEVVVTDARGKPVTDLTKQDFTVLDEGKPRGIDIFNIVGGAMDQNPAVRPASPGSISMQQPSGQFSNRNAPPPQVSGHSTVIVLDQVNAFLEDSAYAREQVMSLLKKLPLDERIALYVIARREGLIVLQDYTTDRALLLKGLKGNSPRGLQPSTPPPPTTAVRDGQQAGPGAGTAAAVAAFKGGDQPRPPGLAPGRLGPDEALTQWIENSRAARMSLQALADHLALIPGRKSVYWVTQAFPSWLMKEKKMGSPPPMEMNAWNKTITALNEADVAVNTVDARGLLRGVNPNEGTLDSMQEIAGRTGGTAYFNRNDLDVAMADGIAASRLTYTLGFYLPDNERDNKFHILKVQVSRPGLQLSSRQGYYAGNAEPPVSRADDLESVLLNQTDTNRIGITAHVEITPGSPRGTANIQLNLDPTTVSLKARDSGWTGKIEEMFIEQDATGATLGKISDTKEFDVPASDRAHFDKDGVAWPMAIPLAPDAVKMTIVVRDSNGGNTGSLTVPLPSR